jgi:hypothetical protein
VIVLPKRTRIVVGLRLCSLGLSACSSDASLARTATGWAAQRSSSFRSGSSRCDQHVERRLAHPSFAGGRGADFLVAFGVPASMGAVPALEALRLALETCDVFAPGPASTIDSCEQTAMLPANR